ncbi:YveK family protein [Guptibacillus sedimenti]|uniref:YveK family protein n=1 Tax=Guptibacillus sedimenti TaxID=3025680 RepID=UPI0023606B9A|nr:Wzz/FepE/Etk N-terminal domain-containing protein [Pseudalkalibacillus sedimenti]
MSKFQYENNSTNSPDKEINLKEYFAVLKSRFWIVIVFAFLTTAGGYFYSQYTYVPLFETSTRIIVETEEQDMKTLMVMIKDPIIMEKVKKDLNLQSSAEGIANRITVEQVDESRVVRISVIDTNPKEAVAIANATAKTYKSEVVKLLDFKEVQLLSEAKLNPYPINESQNKVVMAAAVFGLIAGVGLIFLLDSLDGTVKRESDVEEILGVPVIGSVSNMNKKKFVSKKRKARSYEVRSESVDLK